MPTNFIVQLLSKISWEDIGGIPYCVWGYKIAWSVQASELKGRIGLIFSSRIDLKDPVSFPGVQAIQGTKVLKVSGDDKQYIFKDLDPSTTQEVELFFLAPGVEDSFTPVLLGTEIPEGGNWKFLSFQTNRDGPASLTQTLRGPAFICPPKSDPAYARRLNNSVRRVPKATLVSFQLGAQPSDFGGAVPKFGFLNQLRLQLGEVDAARGKLLDPGRPKLQLGPADATHFKPLTADSPLWDALKTFEGSPIPSQLPSPSVFASVPAATLLAFGRAVVEVRQQAITELKRRQAPDLQFAGGRLAEGGVDTAKAINMLNAAAVASNGFENSFQITPVGCLHLERIEMAPAGIERGELIATIPLAPLEKTAVVHKEWSVTTKEFTSIVTDSLENYSETGVTENTELAQSTTSQTTHSNQFNVNGTVTGTYGPVTATVSSGFSAQDQNTNSANESTKHAISTTRKASSRVKQEHKVTISTTTVTGTSETSTRVLENSSPTDPIRIDYFSMMRKWHVGLYRYGVRLTYDIAIPEPASAMRKTYKDLENLKKNIGPFRFLDSSGNQVTHGEIASRSYADLQKLADEFGATIPPEIEAKDPLTPNINPNLGDGKGWHFVSLEFEVPQDYKISNVRLVTLVGAIGDSDAQINPIIFVLGTEPLLSHTYPDQKAGQGADRTFNQDLGNFLQGATGRQAVYFNLWDAGPSYVQLTVSLEPTPQRKQQWANDVWNALYNAAQTQYYATQQDIAAQIAALEDKIANVDTLTLRREENEEIQKNVLRWLLGPNFDFVPKYIVNWFEFANADVTHGTALDVEKDDGLNVISDFWFPMFMYGEMVKFINEAIEWENVLYFLYSYFWDMPPSWDFIRLLRHPDPTRQAFLRAGSARVVLTVRPGWEKAWVAFVEAGIFGDTFDPRVSHPYMDIAEEIQNYAQTNYPGIPPANPGGGPLPDGGEYAATVSSDTLSPSGGQPVTIAVKSSDGFLVGYTAVLDSYEPTAKDANGKNVSVHQENQRILAVPDATHITVERIEKPHDGSQIPFPIYQAGEKGQLIAEWFEYTPTSGTDIAVTSNLETIS